MTQVTGESRGTAPDRVLATVLFTDIVASTKRLAELGDRGWRDLLRDHHARVREELERFGGREIGTAGDGFLATFEGPERAVRCACAIRDAVRPLGIEIRSGLHTGEVVFGETVGGIAVHIGARVAAKAGAGEVLVSSTVRNLVEGSGIGFQNRGSHVLKGVPGHWQLFAVSGNAVGTGEALAPGRLPRLVWSRRRVAGLIAFALLLSLAGVVLFLRHRGGSRPETPIEAAAPGIAVLPFQVNDPALETWREGMVDLLSINLDDVPGLRAIDSRTVLARWNERVGGTARPDLAQTLEVARSAEARYALVGSAASIGPEVRFTAEVYDVAKGTSLGRAQVQGSPDSVLGLVDRLSIEVLRSFLPVNASPLSHVNLASVTTHSLPALKAYLDGEAFWRHSDFSQAISAYQRALEADSTFALALLRLGFGWSFLHDEEFTPPDPQRLAGLLDRLPEREALIGRANLIVWGDSLQKNLKGLDLLLEAARKYPDEADIWYELGELYSHFGGYAAGIGQLDAGQAFSRAIALDSSYAPAYIHLIDSAFAHADSARAATFLHAYGKVAAGSENERVVRLAFALAFGDQVTRSEARAGLDTIPATDLHQVFWRLGHARSNAVREEVVRTLREDPNDPDPSFTRWLVFHVALRGGKLHEALAALEDSLTYPWFRGAGLYYATAWGLPVAPDRLERELALGTPDSFPDWKTAPGSPEWFYVGAYAADRGRWADHAVAIARVRSASRQLEAEGIGSEALTVERMAQALEGYALWKRGRRPEALQRLEAAQQLTTGQINGPVGWLANTTVNLWIGRLLLELRPREAARYFERSFGSLPGEGLGDPLPAFYLGKAYEESGEYVKAREAYEFFSGAWLQADPEVQPMVTEALRAASRLRSVIRE